jgi:hypothetical protein
MNPPREKLETAPMSTNKSGGDGASDGDSKTAEKDQGQERGGVQGR